MEMQSLIKTRTSIDVPVVATPAILRPEYSAEAQSGSVIDYWNAIWKHNLTLAVLGVVGLGIGVGVTLSRAPMYRAITSIEIQDAKEDNLAAKILNPQPDSTTVDALTDIQTQMKILQSQSLIERALDKAKVASLADLGRPETSSWLRFAAPESEENRDRLVEKVGKKLKVTAVSGTRIVEVSYEATDPALAARFANMLTAEFIEQNLEARGQLNRKTSDWLVSQLNDVRGTLQHSEDALQTYARKNGLIYTGDKQFLSEERLKELQTGLVRVQTDRAEKQARFEIARTATPESVPEVLSDGNLRSMESNLTDLQKQEAEMGVTFKPDYAKAKRLRAEIDSLESAIERKRTVIVSRLDNELQESQRREQLLQAAYAKQTRLVTDDSEKSIQYDMLKHEVDTNRQIYQVMLQRVKEANIASALKATNVRVIDPAKAPLHPFGTGLPINAAGGLLCGLMFGVAGVIIRSKVNGTVQEPGDAGMLLGIPELGVIPSAGPGLARASRLLTLFSKETDAENRSLQVISSPNVPPLVADSLRAVLTSILFAGARQRQRVLVITSASQGEGKTTTSSNLAATLANMGRKVLLIDGDTRSPRIHSIFGLENSTGLTTTLKQVAINSMLTDTFIQATSVPNLFVLPSGPALQAGADLLFSGTMPALITRYREQYDMVLIDTPPMMVMPDARILGSFADGVILIASAGKTARSALQAAYRRFVEDHTPVLGVVLNNWDAKMSNHTYYTAYKEAPAECALVKTTARKAVHSN